jgi:hypothetical protein
MANDRPTAFWLAKCPSRGVGLTHMHEYKCDEHMPGQCCECGQFNDEDREKMERDNALLEAGLPPDEQTLPLVDVNQRMRDLGLTDPPEGERDALNWREPKMATGTPDGPPWGRGRSWRGDGGLSPRDKARLGFLIDTEKRQGYK